MSDKILLPTPDDFHVHLRRGSAMPDFARRHARLFGRIMAMPNTKPPIGSGSEIRQYRAEIEAALGPATPGFQPFFAFKLAPGMTAEAVRDCAQAGAIAGKYYPAGSTTNSEDGISDPSQVRAALSAMEDLGIALSIHAEDPTAEILEREGAFIPVLERILSQHPKIRLVVEHISTAELLDFVLRSPGRVAGGVTAHHLLFSLDDLMAEGLDPHLYCKPTLKSGKHRDALRDAVFRGESKLFFGSDSAPHARAAKESGKAPSGIYSAPCAVEALAELFEGAKALDRMEAFFCRNGASFYRLPPPEGQLLLEKKAWEMPKEQDGVVPMLAGRRLAWTAVRIG